MPWPKGKSRRKDDAADGAEVDGADETPKSDSFHAREHESPHTNEHG